MKLFKFTLSSLAALLLLANCDSNKEEDITPEEREELKLSTEIATADLTGVETKAGELGFYNREFRLIVKDNYGTIADATSTANTETGSGEGKAAVTLIPPLYWDDLGGKSANLKLIGIYPNDAYSSGDNISWNIATTQLSSNYENNDLMLALTQQYKYADKATPASLLFKHMMTKITLNIGGNLFSDTELDAATVTLNNIPAGTGGTVSLLPVSGEYTYSSPTPTTTVNPAKISTSQYMAIVYPFSASSGDHLATIVVKGNTYYVNLPADKDFIAGCNHIFNVAINKSEVSVTAQMVDWSEETTTVDSKLTFTIDAVSISAAIAAKITAGSKLYIAVKGTTATTHSATYTAETDISGFKWTTTNPIYWDDLDKTDDGKYSCNKITAMLVTGGDANNTDGDCIFIAPEKTLGDDIVSGITLDNLSHPLAKFTITVTTSLADDKIDLDGITQLTFPSGWGTFSIIPPTVGISENTDNTLEGVKQGNDPQYVAFVCPNKTVAKDGTLCSVTVSDGTNTNVYDVILNTEKTFTAGNHYKYTVNITKTGVSFTSQLVDWVDEEGGNINTGL